MASKMTTASQKPESINTRQLLVITDSYCDGIYVLDGKVVSHLICTLNVLSSRLNEATLAFVIIKTFLFFVSTAMSCNVSFAF